MFLKPHTAATEMVLLHLNDKLEKQQLAFSETLNNKQERKRIVKRIESERKIREKNAKRVFVLHFNGDIQASAVEQLREEITMILAMGRAGKDKVVLRLESPGGLVHGYGLAAAQLARIREAGFHLTVCVDKVAASGGYMMACLGQEIIAAPFAVLGSIGVVAQMPNFHQLLKYLKIDFDVYTAGEYKRTVTMFGENSQADKQKFESELQQTHELFKHFVEKYRSQLSLEQVATGEHWYGEDALALKLVDKLQTSDAYLLSLMPMYDVYAIQTKNKPTLAEKLGLQSLFVMHAAGAKLGNFLWQKQQELSYGALLDSTYLAMQTAHEKALPLLLKVLGNFKSK